MPTHKPSKRIRSRFDIVNSDIAERVTASKEALRMAISSPPLAGRCVGLPAKTIQDIMSDGSPWVDQLARLEVTAVRSTAKSTTSWENGSLRWILAACALRSCKLTKPTVSFAAVPTATRSDVTSAIHSCGLFGILGHHCRLNACPSLFAPS